MSSERGGGVDSERGGGVGGEEGEGWTVRGGW